MAIAKLAKPQVPPPLLCGHTIAEQTNWEAWLARCPCPRDVCRVMSLGFRLDLPIHAAVHGIKLLRVLLDNPPLCR